MAKRRLLIAGNWKMHKDIGQTSSFLEQLLATEPSTMVDVVVCPPYTSLGQAAMLLAGSSVGLGAQNVHWAEDGAFTGEVSATMLAEIGVRWVIVGHSERRTLFGETDERALDRALAAQKSGLTVISCIGETLEQREAGDTFAVLEAQTAGWDVLDPSSLVVAYEPVWAIGTGRTATTEQAQEAHAFLRNRLADTFGGDAAEGLRILYGGSLKPSNAHELLAQPDVDGGLIGGASLDVDSFSAIIRAADECAAGD
jgi:triosephosphate isomerase